MSLKENSLLSQLTRHPALRRMVSSPLLVLVLEEFSVRGIVLEKHSPHSIEIKAFAEVLLDHAGHLSNRIKITKILEKLPIAQVRRVLLVCEEVQCIPLWLPEPPRKKKSSASWWDQTIRTELTPYLEESPDQYLITPLWLNTEDREEDLFLAEENKQPALIFAVRSNVYNAFASMFKSYKLQLVGISGLESHAFAISHDSVSRNDSYLLIDWKYHEISGSFLKQGELIASQRENIQAEDLEFDALHRLIDRLTDDPHSIKEIIIGGEMVEKLDWEKVCTEQQGIMLKQWNIKEELPQVLSLNGIPSRYMTAIGAAVHFLTADKKRKIWCDQRQPLSIKIRQNIHTVPLILFAVILLGMGGEYGYLVHQKKQLTSKVAKLKKEEKTLSDQVREKEKLDRQLAQKRQEKIRRQQSSDMILHEIPNAMADLSRILQGLVEETPLDVQLLSFEQVSDGIFYLEGKSQNIKSVQSFPVNLLNIPVIQETKLEKSEERIETPKNLRASRVYFFRIRIRLQDHKKEKS